MAFVLIGAGGALGLVTTYPEMIKLAGYVKLDLSKITDKTCMQLLYDSLECFGYKFCSFFGNMHSYLDLFMDTWSFSSVQKLNLIIMLILSRFFI